MKPYLECGGGGSRISAEACPDTLSLSTPDKSNCGINAHLQISMS